MLTYKVYRMTHTVVHSLHGLCVYRSSTLHTNTTVKIHNIIVRELRVCTCIVLFLLDPTMFATEEVGTRLVHALAMHVTCTHLVHF